MSQEEGQVLYRSRTDVASLGITTADTALKSSIFPGNATQGGF